jgi:acetyltransferase
VSIEDIRSVVLAAIESVAPETAVQAIKPDQPLRQQTELDSIDWVNVISALSDRLSIEIPESDYGQLATLDSIVAYAAARQAGLPGERPRGGTAPALGELPTTSHVLNGTLVNLRPIRADDMQQEADFVRHLALDSRYKRFMGTVRELPETKLKYLTDVDQVRHVALVATADRGGRPALVGVVRYVVDPTGTGCEFAVAIDDAWQGSGLGGVLMHALIGVARSRGLARMEGSVLATNTRMLKFARQLGFKLEHDPDDRTCVRVVRTL